MSTIKLSWWAVLLSFVVAAGCGVDEMGRESASLAPVGGKYLLSSEPADPQTPTDIKESVTQPASVAVAGRIDAGDIEPFQSGVASFILSQLPDESHAEGDPDHAENCPFCRRKLKNAPKAIVRLLDEDGNVKQVDARELLGVAKGDIVVVQGVATYLEPVNTVQIDAEGIFIR